MEDKKMTRNGITKARKNESTKEIAMSEVRFLNCFVYHVHFRFYHLPFFQSFLRRALRETQFLLLLTGATAAPISG
jgi:hypothetical protein